MGQKTEEQSRKPHPLADKAMAAIVTKGLGAKAAIPAKAFASLRHELLGHVEDVTAFEDLCVMWFRLKEGGLLVAAKQLLELATIGLRPAELESAIARAESGVSAAQAAAKKQNVGTVTHEIKKSTNMGVGLRGKKNAPTKKI